MDPRFPANRGWGWGWAPDPRQIGGGTPTPTPGEIGGGARGGGGDRGFRALRGRVTFTPGRRRHVSRPLVARGPVRPVLKPTGPPGAWRCHRAQWQQRALAIYDRGFNWPATAQGQALRAIFGRGCCKVQGSCHHEPRTPPWMLPDASGHTAGPTGTYMLVAPHIKRLKNVLKAKKEKGRTDRTTLRWVTPSPSSTMGVLAQIWVDSGEQVSGEWLQPIAAKTAKHEWHYERSSRSITLDHGELAMRCSLQKHVACRRQKTDLCYRLYYFAKPKQLESWSTAKVATCTP